MPEKEKGKKNLIFNWLAKGTRAEPWPTAEEVVESDEFKKLQEIGKRLVRNRSNDNKNETSK